MYCRNYWIMIEIQVAVLARRPSLSSKRQYVLLSLFCSNGCDTDKTWARHEFDTNTNIEWAWKLLRCQSNFADWVFHWIVYLKSNVMCEKIRNILVSMYGVSVFSSNLILHFGYLWTNLSHWSIYINFLLPILHRIYQQKKYLHEYLTVFFFSIGC